MNERKNKLETLQLKCDDILSDLKKRRKEDYVINMNTGYYDDHIKRVEYLNKKISEELHMLTAHEDMMMIDELFHEYNMEDALIQSLRLEFENLDKESWYDKEFGGWEKMPVRQDCDCYPLSTRLEYSRRRREMFDYLERKFKLKIFGPNLADRLEFF